MVGLDSKSKLHGLCLQQINLLPHHKTKGVTWESFKWSSSSLVIVILECQHKTITATSHASPREMIMVVRVLFKKSDKLLVQCLRQHSYGISISETCKKKIKQPKYFGIHTVFSPTLRRNKSPKDIIKKVFIFILHNLQLADAQTVLLISLLVSQQVKKKQKKQKE